MCDAMLLHNPQNSPLFSKVNFFEDIFWMLFDFSEILDVPRIGETIEIDQQLHLGSLHDMMNKIGTDKTGSASNE